MDEEASPGADDGRKHGRSLYSNAGCRCDVCREAHRRYQAEWKRRAIERTRPTGTLPTAVEHGTPNAFNNYGCRCRPCLDAWATARRQRKAELRESGEVPTTVRHGTESTYVNYDCRCDRCRAAWREASRRRSARDRAG